MFVELFMSASSKLVDKYHLSLQRKEKENKDGEAFQFMQFLANGAQGKVRRKGMKIPRKIQEFHQSTLKLNVSSYIDYNGTLACLVSPGLRLKMQNMN